MVGGYHWIDHPNSSETSLQREHSESFRGSDSLMRWRSFPKACAVQLLVQSSFTRQSHYSLFRVCKVTQTNSDSRKKLTKIQRNQENNKNNQKDIPRMIYRRCLNAWVPSVRSVGTATAPAACFVSEAPGDWIPGASGLGTGSWCRRKLLTSRFSVFFLPLLRG